MESVKQMQRAASSHCSLLRHTELFLWIFAANVFLPSVLFIFFFLIQFNTCFIFYKNLFLLLSFGEPGPPAPVIGSICSCDTRRDLLGLKVQPALFQLWRKSTDSPFWPTASDTDKTETGLQREQPAKYVVNCSVRGEAAIKQRWQRGLELRRLFTWKPTTVLFLQLRL